MRSSSNSGFSLFSLVITTLTVAREPGGSLRWEQSGFIEVAHQPLGLALPAFLRLGPPGLMSRPSRSYRRRNLRHVDDGSKELMQITAEAGVEAFFRTVAG